MNIVILVYVIRAFIGILITILNVLLSPVLPLFIRDGYLPSWLSWFQTPDNPAIGDKMFHEQQMSWTKSDYLYAVFWAIRNPGYGYDAWAGFIISPDCGYSSAGNENICVDRQYDGSYKVIEGSIYRKLTQDGKTYFQWRYIKKWSAHRAMRLSFGWVLHQPLVPWTRRNLEFTISPAMAC